MKEFAGRPATLAVFDLDGTLMPGGSQKRFLDFLLENGWIGRVRYFLICGWFVLFKLGVARDVEAIQRLVFASLAGRDAARFDALAGRFYGERIRGTIYPSARELVRKHLEEGDELLLVSNAVEPVVRRAAADLGIGRCIATRPAEEEGRLTGKIDGGNVYGDHKAHRVAGYLRERGIPGERAWAYCDHISDLPLLLSVGKPVAVNPDAELAREAAKRGIRVIRLAG